MRLDSKCRRVCVLLNRVFTTLRKNSSILAMAMKERSYGTEFDKVRENMTEILSCQWVTFDFVTVFGTFFSCRQSFCGLTLAGRQELWCVCGGQSSHGIPVPGIFQSIDVSPEIKASYAPFAISNLKYATCYFSSSSSRFFSTRNRMSRIFPSV